MRTQKKDKTIYEMTQLELEAWAVNLRRQGLSIPSIQYIATSQLNDNQQIIELSKQIEIICKSFQSYETVEFVISSDLNKVADRDEYFIYNSSSKKRMVMKPSSLGILFNPEFMYKKVRHLYDTYNPRTTEVYIKDNGKQCFNLYCPPPWLEDHFYGRKKLEKQEIPELYKEFFLHLVNNDIESYNYLIKWLANSLVTRNYCYLVTIGQMGIGKGLLYAIASLLHGLDNSEQNAGEVFFNTTFNSDLENKTLFYINEIPKLTDKDSNRLKMMVEEKLRIEKKGQTAKSIDNHLNLMISSNDLSALPISKDERRYSIITLTNTPTREGKWKNYHDEWVESLKAPENIARLGAYLITNVDVNPNEMIHPFKSKEQIRLIKSMQLQDWEDWFLFSYCKDKAGQIVSLSQIRNDVVTGTNSRINITSRLLKKLKEKIPGFFVFCEIIREDGEKGATGIKFKPLNEQPKRKDLNLEIKENED